MSQIARDLPDSIWLEILQHVELWDLVDVACISRRMNNLVQDRKLWQIVDLTPHLSITIRSIKKLVRKPFAEHIETLKIEGYLRRLQFGGSYGSRKIATPALMNDIQLYCPRISELHIIYANLTMDNFTIGLFPRQLQFVSLEGTLVNPGFFVPLQTPSTLSKLTGIDVSYCHNVSSLVKGSIQSLLGRMNLTSLRLNHCYKLSEDHLNSIPRELPNLEILSARDIERLKDAFLQNISVYSNKLRVLDVSHNSGITDNGIKWLTSLSSVCRGILENLHLIQTAISDVALHHMSSLTNLRHLNIIKTRCTQASIDYLMTRLPYCQISSKLSDSTAAHSVIGHSVWFLPLESTDANAMVE